MKQNNFVVFTSTYSLVALIQGPHRRDFLVLLTQRLITLWAVFWPPCQDPLPPDIIFKTPGIWSPASSTDKHIQQPFGDYKCLTGQAVGEVFTSSAAATQNLSVKSTGHLPAMHEQKVHELCVNTDGLEAQEEGWVHPVSAIDADIMKNLRFLGDTQKIPVVLALRGGPSNSISRLIKCAA